jgi:hypothetical protein
LWKSTTGTCVDSVLASLKVFVVVVDDDDDDDDDDDNIFVTDIKKLSSSLLIFVLFMYCILCNCVVFILC